MRSGSASGMVLVRRYLLLGVVALGAIALSMSGRVAGTSAAASATPESPAAASLSPAGKINHVVVIYQENHSFDETLGKFCQLHGGRCDGYVGPVRLEDG